jgi:hypothetical protein
LNATFNIQGNSQPITYQYYYDSIYRPGLIPIIAKYTIGLPGLLIKAIKGNEQNGNALNDFGLINVTENEFEHFKRLDNQVLFSLMKRRDLFRYLFPCQNP